MGRASTIQNTCNAGELSPLLLGRQDLAKYNNGLFVCLNAVPLTQGAWTRRPGTAFLHQCKFNNKLTRVLPFQYSITQTYILEFGAGYIRFYTVHGLLTNTAQSITSITKANPGVVTKVAHGYANGDRLFLSSVVGMTQLSSREIVVTNKTADTFELYDSDGVIINTTAYDTFTSGNMAKILEITTAFTEAQLADIRVTQSTDTLYVLHPNYMPQLLTRTAPTVWTFSSMLLTDGPYDNVNVTATTLTPSAAVNAAGVAVTATASSGGLIRVTAVAHTLNTSDHAIVSSVNGTLEANGMWIVTRIDANTVDLQGSTFVNAWTSGGNIVICPTLTASAITGINNNTGFQATDDGSIPGAGNGRLVRLQQGTIWGYAQIGFVTSTTVVHINILSTLTSTAAKTAWRLGIWSDTTGYPIAGTFYEDRLWLGGAASFPQRLDGSKTSLFTNFSPSATDGTVADNNAVSRTLNSDDVNAIQWLTANEKGLLAGTARGEWRIQASTLGIAITPTNINAQTSTRFGSASVAPVQAGKATLYVQRAGRKLREMAYDLYSDGFKAPDLSLLSEHITQGGILQMAYQGQPQAVVWSVRADGVLLGFTYERDQEVTAWHRHELGGASDAAKVFIPVVESIAVVPAPDASRDELYQVVQRYVAGGVKRYIEYGTKIWETNDFQEDAFFLDCGWTQIDVAATNEIHGLTHLEGETVSVYADGTKQPDAVVTNGKITLSNTFFIKTVGYSYTSDGQTMPVEGGAQDGSAQGKIKRIHQVGFWLLDTLGLKYGPDSTHLTEIIVHKWGDIYGAATPLFTGVFRDRLESDYDKLGQVFWRADGPFPATVLAIMPQFNVYDAS